MARQCALATRRLRRPPAGMACVELYIKLLSCRGAASPAVGALPIRLHACAFILYHPQAEYFPL